MLSAGSFSSPYEHLSQPETKRMVEHYTAYLSDNTRLIANPGLKVNAHTQTHTYSSYIITYFPDNVSTVIFFTKHTIKTSLFVMTLQFTVTVLLSTPCSHTASYFNDLIANLDISRATLRHRRQSEGNQI